MWQVYLFVAEAFEYMQTQRLYFYASAIFTLVLRYMYASWGDRRSNLFPSLHGRDQNLKLTTSGGRASDYQSVTFLR